MRRIRSHWPHTRLTVRGDGHYGRPEVMAWCEVNDGRLHLRPAGRARLSIVVVEPVADDVRVRRAETSKAPVARRYCEIRYGARSWHCERRVAARIEATTQGLDIRYVVTNITGGSAEWLYDSLYCARGQAENLIKLHKTQLASDRTSCRSPLANQVRLVLHTGAYWLLLKLAMPFQAAAACHRRVHHVADAPDPRRPHRRNRKPGAHRVRRGTPRRGLVRQPRTLSPTGRAVTAGACPQPPDSANPPNACQICSELAIKARIGKPRRLIRSAALQPDE